MALIYLALRIEDARCKAVARRQNGIAFFEICQTAWILIHRCGPSVIVRSLPGNDVQSSPLRHHRCRGGQCGGTKEVDLESNLAISHFPCHECICTGSTPLRLVYILNHTSTHSFFIHRAFHEVKAGATRSHLLPTSSTLSIRLVFVWSVIVS
jgi:hypothetical protein